MCNEAVYRGPWHLKYVPDWFVTEQQLKLWYDYNDSEYCDDDIEDNFFKWHEGYEKRMVQKASIKEELLPITWHPSRYWDWCMSEEKKKETEALCA